LTQYLYYLKDEVKIPFEKVTFKTYTQNISAHLDWLENINKCSISTRNLRLACIKAFYTYACSNEPLALIHVTSINKIPIKKTAESPNVKYMSIEAIQAILKQPDTKTMLGLRDQVLMILLYDSATRIQELLSLTICDLRLGNTPTITVLGKGNKKREIPISERTSEHLKNYLNIWHPDEKSYSKSPLFYSMRNNKKCVLSSDTIRKMMKKYGIKARQICLEVPENLHPHLWRHSKATHLLAGNMDMSMLSKFLGHSSLDVTSIYANVNTEQKREAILKAHDGKNPISSQEVSEAEKLDSDERILSQYHLI
jgi:site-specific recombinase XerD